MTKIIPKPLDTLDILVTIFNQEEIIEKVLFGIFRNTTTPFNLILIFDGCSDRTKPRALAYIDRVKPKLLKELITKDTPNLFELRANNFGFKLAKSKYLITLQDDMVIGEYGWERRLTYPIRVFDDVLGVTARIAEDLKPMENWNQQYINRVGRELGILSRDIFAIRDTINRGPIAFRVDYLKELNYLNDRYAPGALDDLELSLRAWKLKKWKVGTFWIKYTSKLEWSKVNSSDSTMKAWDSAKRNERKIVEDFNEYIVSGMRHGEDHILGENNIDYVKGGENVWSSLYWFTKYPLRLDKRVIFNRLKVIRNRLVEAIKYPIMRSIQLVISPELSELIKDEGFKRGIKTFLAPKSKPRYMTICIPTHEMKGYDKFLRHSLDVLAGQTFKDFDIVISDHSKKDNIKNICKEYSDRLDIHYYRNPKGPYTSSANLNNAISKARGKIVKVLFLDDYLHSSKSLQEIVDNFDLEKDHWLVTGSEHTHDGVNYYMPFYPKYHDDIHLGINTISSPSVLTIKNDKPLLFDKRMIWLMDVDYYKRLHNTFGPPKILNTINVVNTVGDHQVSNTAAGKHIRGLEYRWVLKKHNEKKLLKEYDSRVVTKINLPKVTLVAIGKENKYAFDASQDGITYGKVLYKDHLKSEELSKYIDTDFVLSVSAKGFVLRPYKWKDEYMNYDMIGDNNFSLKSAKCIKGNRDIKIAPEEISRQFYTTKNFTDDTFGFSGDSVVLPKLFFLKKYLKKVKIISKIRRWVSILRKGH